MADPTIKRGRKMLGVTLTPDQHTRLVKALGDALDTARDLEEALHSDPYNAAEVLAELADTLHEAVMALAGVKSSVH